jgi:glycosyltransferase involved in cell wall biosynthesis
VNERLPSFDLVLATLGRVEEPRAFLESLERQGQLRVRVLVIDQNGDDRLAPVLAAHPRLDLRRIAAPVGLARARNAALPELSADLVAFPDDDCVYPDGLLLRVAAMLADRPELDGLTGRGQSSDGRSSDRWPGERMTLRRERIWHGGSSYTIFLRRGVVERVGRFDERLGLGSGTPWCSGEEIDYLIRALETGALIEYDPEIAVAHPLKQLHGRELVARGRRDGGSVGFILRKHRYPPRTLARMLVRPVGGALLALVRGDPWRARFHLATLRGRIAGYRAATPEG